MVKLCKRCNKAPRVPGRGYCKPCDSERVKEYYKKNRAKRQAYYHENRDTQRVNKQTASAKARGFEIVEKVDVRVVHERDKGICQICGKGPIDLDLDRKSPLGATVHHIEPIHSYATVQLAHYLCNQTAGQPW
jgi:hypothetical protein